MMTIKPKDYPAIANVMCDSCKRCKLEDDIYFHHCHYCKWDKCYLCSKTVSEIKSNHFFKDCSTLFVVIICLLVLLFNIQHNSFNY